MSASPKQPLSRVARQLVASFVRHPPRLLTLGTRSYQIWRTGGWRGFQLQIEDRLREQRARAAYRSWVETYDTLTESDRRLILTRIAELRHQPLISVVMPVYNVDEIWLRPAIESVRRQLYPRWELCIADDNSTKPHVRRVLAEYAAQDPRIKVVYRDTNGHISHASNSALELAGGDFVALLDHDDELSEHALYLVAEEINAHPEADLIYSDEDLLDENGVRSAPYFKPDWSPDLLCSLNMISHLGVYRTSVLREIGGFRAGYEGSQDYDLALRVAESVPAAHVRHIPHVLYHWRTIPGSAALHVNEKSYAPAAARRAIASHLGRAGVRAEVKEGHSDFHRVVYPVPASPPPVSLIMAPARGGEPARETVNNVLARTDYPPPEVIVVEEEAMNGERRATHPESATPNRPARINAAVRAAFGDLICLLGDAVRVISPGWLREMVGHALRDEIGVVGAKLYYPDDTISHAGMILGARGVAAGAHEGFLRKGAGHLARALVIQNFSAVSAACLVTRRSVFEQLGGFDAVNLPCAYWDLDYCLRARERGYRVLWTPYAELYQWRRPSPPHEQGAHHPVYWGSSPAPESCPESGYMMRRWGDTLLNDPYYNPNLSLRRADYTIAIPPRLAKAWEREAV